MSTLETYIRAGLRFTPADAPKLLDLARRARNRELGQQAVEHFAQAAICADLGKPMIVIAASIDDLHQQVAAYTRAGITQPAIETLTA